MMATKPVAYPNLIASMQAVVESHQGIHDAIQQHAQEHTAKIEAKRRAISVQQDAEKLMKS